MSDDSRFPGDTDHTATMPTSDLERTEGLSDDDRPTRVIDRYHLLQKIGEGGMGEVWEAEQVRPVQRRVALKLIKRGMDTDQVIARFETERQALALMDHQAIARVYDAGTTERGRPYFVMERVHGVPITDYCDRHRLSVHQRLKLFIEVCEGIQHAHQRAIIHRDVKPSNILVAEQEDRPVPKIIDFGIAKATSKRLTERTLFTELGQFIGTPEYMSPEQAKLTVEDIDIRTDVYSLGMVLFELLAGALPFDSRELRQAGFAELQRRIREDEPPKPSTQVTRNAEASVKIAENRLTTVSALVKALRGDLDRIVLKALEKDRNRRYETAHAFAMDIERFLTDRVVEARSPSTAYRARKFVRRHRLGVAAASLILVALVLGIVLATVGFVRAKRAETRATQEALTATRVSEFLVELFEVSDPGEARGNTITAREVLDTGAARVESELEDQPQIQARLMHTMSRVFGNLGLYEESAQLGRDALARREAVFGPDDPKVAESLYDLADVEMQRGEYAEAGTLLRRTLTIRQDRLGADHPQVAEAYQGLAILNFYLGDYGEAETLFRRALAMWEGALGPDDPALASGFNDLATLLYTQGRYEEAAVLFQRALDLWQETLGEDHHYVATALNNIGAAYKSLGDYVQAEPHYRRALELWERTLGPDHPEVASSLNNLGSLYRRIDRTEEAIEHYERATEIWEYALGPDHPDVAIGLSNLAVLYRNEGDFSLAEPLFDRALAIRGHALGADHADVFLSLRQLGDLYRRQGRLEAAEIALRQALEGEEGALGPDHPNLADGMHSLALLCAEQGRYAEGEELYLRALPITEAALGSDHPDFLTLSADYGALLVTMGRPDEAALLETGDTSSWTTPQPPT